MNDERLMLEKRFLDLYSQADRRNMIIFTDFLNIAELNIIKSLAPKMPFVKQCFWGGYQLAERQIVALIPEALIFAKEFTVYFPFECIQITPSNIKFAEELNHRDYLGTFISTGIDRSKLGDIIVNENVCYCMCSSSISKYLLDEISRIRHTTVNAKLHEELFKQDFSYNLSDEFIYHPDYNELSSTINFIDIDKTVSSFRLDSIVAAAISKSRNTASELIREKNVIVNGFCQISKDYVLKQSDVISIRGFGKYIFFDSGGKTSKNRFHVTLKKYN